MRRRLVFADRVEAGRLLGERLARWSLRDHWCSPCRAAACRSAAEIARILRAPLDVTLVRKIGAPSEPELAVGAVAEGPSPEIVVNDEVGRALGSER